MSKSIEQQLADLRAQQIKLRLKGVKPTEKKSVAMRLAERADRLERAKQDYKHYSFLLKVKRYEDGYDVDDLDEVLEYIIERDKLNEKAE